MKVDNYYINQNSGDGSWSDLLGDVYSGIAVGMGHSKKFVGMTVHQALASIFGIDNSMTGGVDDAEISNPSISATGDSDNDGGTTRGLRVVGVGYGRTGTYSLALALDELGFPTLVSLLSNSVPWNLQTFNFFFASPRSISSFLCPLFHSIRNISTKTLRYSIT